MRRTRAIGGDLTKVANLFVTVEGTDPKTRKLARKELVSFYSTFASHRRDVVLGVQVPRNLAEAVAATLDLGQGVKGRFSAQGHHHAVRGTTIPVRSRDSLSFAMLFHPGIFGREPWRRKRWRQHIYAHEEGHVLDYLALEESIGRARFFTESSSVRDFVLRRAYHVVSEYRAERWAVESDLRSRGGREPTASRDFPSYELEVEGLTVALKELRPWLTWIAETLHAGKVPFGEFARSVLARLDEILNYAAYASARADALMRNFRSLSEMRNDPMYAFFFQTFEDLEPRLRSLAPISAGYDEARLGGIAESLVAFYDCCGLRLADGANGIEANVRVPTFERSRPPPTGTAPASPTTLSGTAAANRPGGD